MALRCVVTSGTKKTALTGKILGSFVFSNQPLQESLKYCRNFELKKLCSTSCRLSSPRWSTNPSLSDKTDGINEHKSLEIWNSQENITNNLEEENSLVFKKSVTDMSLPEMSRNRFSVVPYMSKSETLQKLVQLGVDLDIVQQVDKIAELLLKSNFEKHISPLILFINALSVEDSNIGKILTNNPKLFSENVEDLEGRVGYLLSKKWTLSEIKEMVENNSIFLLMNPLEMDEKLAFYQQSFHLSARELRGVMTKCPLLLPYRKELVTYLRYNLSGFCGFETSEISQIIKSAPEIFFLDPQAVVERFDYVHNYMDIPHELIILYPKVLEMDTIFLKERNKFLLWCRRAQYDATKENYVPLVEFCKAEKDFITDVAKSNFDEYINFLKTL